MRLFEDQSPQASYSRLIGRAPPIASVGADASALTTEGKPPKVVLPREVASRVYDLKSGQELTGPWRHNRTDPQDCDRPQWVASSPRGPGICQSHFFSFFL